MLPKIAVYTQDPLFVTATPQPFVSSIQLPQTPEDPSVLQALHHDGGAAAGSIIGTELLPTAPAPQSTIVGVSETPPSPPQTAAQVTQSSPSSTSVAGNGGANDGSLQDSNNNASSSSSAQEPSSTADNVNDPNKQAKRNNNNNHGKKLKSNCD